MGMHGLEPPWDDDDDDSEESNEQEVRPPLPPSDRVWRHPSEAAKLAEMPTPPPRRRRRILALVIAAILLVSILVGADIGGIRSIFSGTTAKKSASGTAPTTLVLPSAIAQKVSKLAGAVTQVRKAAGETSVAGTFIGASGYLVVPAKGLAVNDKLTALDAKGTWQSAVVAAVDPLTDAAILRTKGATPSFLASYTKDSPTQGSMALIVYNGSGGKSKTVLAAVVSTGEPLTLSQKFYIPDAIKITPSDGTIPLGSLVLDSEGDPVGMVVKTAKGSDGPVAWATPLPSVGRITSLVVQHRGVLHGYLGVVGETVMLTDGSKYAAGVKIDSIVSGSPAAVAKLPVGAVIVAVDGTEVPTLSSLQSLLLSREPGSKVDLKLDNSGAVSDVTVGLTNHP